MPPQHDENLDDEAWGVRETFAHFGQAYYMSSVLEVGLAHCLMWGEFMMQQVRKIKATKGKGFDRKQYEADFDTFMDNQFAQSMGNIVRRATSLSYFTEELNERIAAAKKRRGYLAHHYWREASERFMTSKGRETMRDELLADAHSFGKLDRDIDTAMKAAREKLGIDDTVLEEYSEAMMDRIKAGLPWEDTAPNLGRKPNP